MDAYTILLFLSICRAELGSRLWWILMWKGLWSIFLHRYQENSRSFSIFFVFSLLVFLFGTSEAFICAIIKINCAMFGVIIFLVLCLDVLGTMCGGNSSWGE